MLQFSPTFRLRTLLIGMVPLCILLTVGRDKLDAARQQATIVAEIERRHGVVYYDADNRADKRSQNKRRPTSSSDLSRILGRHLFDSVVAVDFSGHHTLTAADLAQLEQPLQGLPDLRTLCFVWGSDFDQHDLDQLSKSLPDCKIVAMYSCMPVRSAERITAPPLARSPDQ